MARLAVVAIFVLVASGLSRGQATASTLGAKAGTVAAGVASHNTDQTDNGNGEIPTFHAQARQVLVTVSVWKHVPENKATVPERIWTLSPVEGHLYAGYEIVRGLSEGDFRVFDDGSEQKINSLEEFDFSWRDTNVQWNFTPRGRGTWGDFINANLSFAGPAAIYVIGYAPPLLQSGDCHTIRVVAGNNEVVANRDHYCTADQSDPATAEGSDLAARMEHFAKSGKRGDFRVSSRPFVFWSSSVLSLMRDNPSTANSATESAAARYRYVVVVHDSKAPATVQIATEYETWTVGPTKWSYPCPPNAAIHVLGVVYRANGEVATRFNDVVACHEIPSGDSSPEWPPGLLKLLRSGAVWEDIPTRFNTQVELQPGDYDVHVVVSDGHKFGQARMPLHVEPLDAQALTISDLALNGILQDTSWLLWDASLISPAPVVPAPLVSKHAQFVPAPDSRLRKKSSLPLYFEIYEPLFVDQDPEVYFRIKITNLKNGAVVLNTEPGSAAQCVIPGNVVIPIALNVETEKLPRGEYRLEVQASDSAGRTTEWRTAKFEIQ